MDDMDKTQAASEIYEAAAIRRHFAGKDNRPPLHTASRDCEDCGKRIPAARLAANPVAIRCVKCQTKYEREGEI